MSDTSASLKRKIASAGDLLGVVRTMKAMTASNINQFERAVSALDDYYRTVQLGLVACFRQATFSTKSPSQWVEAQNQPIKMGVLVFGSDQGLVGQFNESLAEFVLADLAKQQGDNIVWVVGERLQSRLAQSELILEPGFVLPKVIDSITPLVGQVLLKMETYRSQGKINAVTIYHNQPVNNNAALNKSAKNSNQKIQEGSSQAGGAQAQSSTIYAPVKQRLLPLDTRWQQDLMGIPWPTTSLPEVMGLAAQHENSEYGLDKLRSTQLALIHEYLFVSLYRACAESLASENASRLAAMQRAEKNIDELLLKMNSSFHSLRQSGIDEELFDVIAGFNALSDS
jgi:F-type H+-transporting ATPase subunit gamma